MEKPKLKPEHLLSEAIGFTQDDLEANVQGRMSDAQCDRLMRKRRDWLMLRNLAAGFVLLLTVCVVRLLSPVDWFFWLVIPVFGLVYTLRQLQNQAADLQLGQVYAVEGCVSLLDGMDNQFFMTVVGIRFSVRDRVFYAFQNGDPYRIYYAPCTRTILSAEWLREE